MDKPKLLKTPNDFVIGLALFALGVFVLFTDKVVQGKVVTGNGGYLVRPDVYVRMMGGCLAFFAVILVLKSINWKRATETKPFKFVISREIVLTIVALIAYVALLPIIHFFAATFLLCFLLTIMYFKKEISATETECPAKKIVIRRLIVAAVYAAILTFAVYLLFAHVLTVALP
jgi:hypothetical protein